MSAEEKTYRKYTAEEKREIVGKYMVRIGAGQSQQAACEELGVRRTSILYWKSIMDNGGELTDTDAGKGHGKGGAATHPDHAKRATNGRKGKYVVVDNATKIRAAQRLLSKQATAHEISKETGVHYTTVHSWAHDYKAGKFGKQPRAVAPPDPGTQIVTLREAPAPRPNGKPPVQLGLALSESEEVLLLRAENARLKAKIRQLLPLVMDSE